MCEKAKLLTVLQVELANEAIIFMYNFIFTPSTDLYKHMKGVSRTPLEMDTGEYLNRAS